MDVYLSLPEKFAIPEYKLKHDNPNYENEVREFLELMKNYFPQLSFFTDKIQESLFQELLQNKKHASIESNHIVYKSSDFQVIPKDENETQKFIDRMKQYVQTPEILDILLRINYIYDSFPSLTPNLDNLLLSISMHNEYPLIKLALISQLFSMPSRPVQDKIYEFETIDINYPGEIVSCIFNQKDQEIIPLTLTNPLFPVSKDSIYLRYYKHDYVFTPSTKTVSFCKTNSKNKISTKPFSDFLIDPEEKVEEIGVFNDQLVFVQRMNSTKNLRITLFRKGILVTDIIKKDYIIELNDEIYKCKIFQNNLLIFLLNGQKYSYSLGKHLLIKDPFPSQFYFDLSHVSIYDKENEVFILPNCDNDKLLYHIIKREKKKSNFVQILPSFYGVQTDEIISRVSFELMNLCTEIISDLIESKSSISTNLVSDPVLHIKYALDLSETIQKNDYNHDQNLCDYCLIALIRFIIINIYQINANQQNLADFQVKRITRLFTSMKMSVPQFDNLFALVSVINYGIYTKSFIKNVLHPFIPLINDKRILQVSSFILFIKPESIASMNTKEKMTFLQGKVKDFVGIYTENNLDKELIPFISTYFEILQESLHSKSVSNIFFCSYFSSLIPFLCTMENTSHLSSVVLSYLFQNFEKILNRVNPVIEKIANFFNNDENFQHFDETKTTEIKFPDFWVDSCYTDLPFYDDIDNYTLVKLKKIKNESFSTFENLTKDDLLIFLLPNAIINLIQVCYNSIKITQAEKDNKWYLSYQINSKEASFSRTSSKPSLKIPKRSSSHVITSHQEEKEFLLQLNEDSILIKRLRKEIRNIFQRNILKEIEEVELLIFKTLLFQSKLIKYAMTVNENSPINPQVKIAWKTAIKVRTNLRLAKQFEANKKEVHLNLKERYDDYIKSIKEKCTFLLDLKNMENQEEDTNECIKQNYSFITSNIPLSELFTLQEIGKERDEIKKKSILAMKKIFKIKMPKCFIRSFVSLLAKNETLRNILNEDDEFYSFLVDSNDSFIHLCAFDFIQIDEFLETALEIFDHEKDPNVLNFLEEIIKEPKQDDIDNALELIGKSSYSYVKVNIKNSIQKISENTKFELLISKLNGFDDISLGVLAVITSFKSIDEKELNLLCPVLVNLQSKLPNEINDLKNKIIVHLYVSSLNLILKFNYDFFKTNILSKIDLSKYENSICLQYFVDADIHDYIELHHEIEEKQQNSNDIDENPYFIQLKGDLSSISELNPNTINCSSSNYNFYVFSKPIQNKEKIGFHFETRMNENTSNNSYVIIGTINMNDEFNCLIPMCESFTNNSFIYNEMDNINDIILMKKPSKNTFALYADDKNKDAYIEIISNELQSEPIIPFILVYESNITITYDYSSEFTPDESYSFKSFYIEDMGTIEDFDELMTIIPKNIIGNRIHIENIGDGVVVKTNDKNDDAEVVLFNDAGDACLANINLESKKCQIIKEKYFVVLIRALTISGFSDMKLIDEFLSNSSSFILSESLFTYLLFNLSNNCANNLSKNKKILKRILSNYKSSFTCLLNDNIEFFANVYSPPHEYSDDSIITNLLELIKADLINDPLRFFLSISDKLNDEEVKSVCKALRYRKIAYTEIDIEKVKLEYEQICKYKKLSNVLCNQNSFLSSFIDILDHLLNYSYETVCQNFDSINNEVILHNILLNKCNYPIGIPLLIAIIYEKYNPCAIFRIEAHKKFILSLTCKNIDNDEILETNAEYECSYDISLSVIKPEIPDVIGLIKKFNETNHIDTFLKLHDKESEIITYPIEEETDEKLTSDILYLYFVLFEKLSDIQDGTLFALKPLDQKLEWLINDLKNYDNYFHFSFKRFQKSNQKKLIFDQFYEAVNFDFIRLRNSKPFIVNFVGEGGLDLGGLRREAISLIYEELMDTNNRFFEIQDDGFFVPSNKCNKKRLEAVGAFIGCCFYSNNPRDFHLAPKIYSYFISESEFDENHNESFSALKKGFNAVVPEINLRYFTAKDVQQLTCGDTLSFDKFIKCCNFCDVSFAQVFIEVVSKFTPNELKKLLQFITGSQTLPFDPDFHIIIDFMFSNGDDENKWPLPVAHTCFNTIDICNFKNSSILADKLRLAMLTEILSDNESNFAILNFE